MANDLYDQIDLTGVNTASELCDTMETAFPELGEVDEKGLSVKDGLNTGAKVLGVIGGGYAIYRGGKWLLDKTGVTKKVKNWWKCKKAERQANKAAK